MLSRTHSSSTPLVNSRVIFVLLVQNNHGILAMLDEECLRPGPVSDDTFLYKLTKVCQESPYFESKGCKNFMADASLPSQCFRLRHYAGAVRKTLSLSLSLASPGEITIVCYLVRILKVIFLKYAVLQK